MAETELDRAEKRFAQAKARLQALRNREATKQRKMDTRRKVILGGALVDLAARDDRAAEMLERLVRNLVREQDRAAFDGWDWRAGAREDGAGSASAENGDPKIGRGMETNAEHGSPDGMASGAMDIAGAETSEVADAARDLKTERAPTRRLIVPDPSIRKEFFAERRARFSGK